MRINTLGQSIGYKSPLKLEGALTESQRLAKEQAALFKKQMEEQAKKLREMQASAERTQWMTPPTAQTIGDPASEDERKRKMGGNRGSLLAGNTGGYNPATGGGRLGGMRSLLG